MGMVKIPGRVDLDGKVEYETELRKVRARTDALGNLRLIVPVGVPDTEVLVIIAHPIDRAELWYEAVENGWPAGFFDQTAGSLAGLNVEYPTRSGDEAPGCPPVTFLLDTNVCFRYLDARSDRVRKRLESRQDPRPCRLLGRQAGAFLRGLEERQPEGCPRLPKAIPRPFPVAPFRRSARPRLRAVSRRN